MNLINIEEAYTKLVRPLSDKEYAELKLSIQDHGLLVPIIVNQNGNVLDGHNRYRICQELGIKPVVVRKEFPSRAHEKLFVIESNLKRRHLTEIERVEIGMQLEPLEKELAKERQEEEGSRYGRGRKKEFLVSNDFKHDGETSSSNELKDMGQARDIVAKKVGVSATTYHRGRTVLEKGSDELKEKVKSGATTISAAYDQVKGKEKKVKNAELSNDLIMLPAELFDTTIEAIKQAKQNGDKQLPMRLDKRNHDILTVGDGVSA